MATLRGAPATSSTTRLPADAARKGGKGRKSGGRRGAGQIVDDATGTGDDGKGVMKGL